MKNLLVILTLPLLVGCASIHEGNEAIPYGENEMRDVRISAEELSDPKAEAFSMISMTFENLTNDWFRIDKVEVLIDENAAKYISVMLGPDLKDWISAMEARARLEQYNREMTQLGVAMLGAAAAVAGGAKGNAGLAAAGGIAVAGTQGWILYDALSAARSLATDPKMIPDEHVMRPFSIPGRMFQKKWLLLNKAIGKRIKVLPIAVTTVDGRRQIYEVKLHD